MHFLFSWDGQTFISQTLRHLYFINITHPHRVANCRDSFDTSNKLGSAEPPSRRFPFRFPLGTSYIFPLFYRGIIKIQIECLNKMYHGIFWKTIKKTFIIIMIYQLNSIQKLIQQKMILQNLSFDPWKNIASKTYFAAKRNVGGSLGHCRVSMCICF